MEKYTVSVRKKAEDWEIPSDIWSDEYYPEPYIEAVGPREAEIVAREFIAQDCSDNPDEYEFLVKKYEE